MDTVPDQPADDGLGADRAFASYQIVLGLWSKENPIKTTKLQVLLAVNALLISVAGISDEGLTHDKWPVYVGAAVFSMVWTFSIGRTALFQSAWGAKLNDFAARYPDDERFHLHETKAEQAAARPLLRILGGVSSKWYLTLSPLAFTIVWLVILLVTLANR
ncbi:MAG TPA: hypothetical protein VGB83_11750 [Actinomycetota bacterium]